MGFPQFLIVLDRGVFVNLTFMGNKPGEIRLTFGFKLRLKSSGFVVAEKILLPSDSR